MSKMLYLLEEPFLKEGHCQNNLDEDLKPSKESTNFAKYCLSLTLIRRYKIMNNIGKGSLFNTMLQQEEIMHLSM